MKEIQFLLFIVFFIIMYVGVFYTGFLYGKIVGVRECNKELDEILRASDERFNQIYIDLERRISELKKEEVRSVKINIKSKDLDKEIDELPIEIYSKKRRR